MEWNWIQWDVMKFVKIYVSVFVSPSGSHCLFHLSSIAESSNAVPLSEITLGINPHIWDPKMKRSNTTFFRGTVCNVLKTMSFFPPIFLGMVSFYHLYIYGDDWGMVNMALF